MARSSTSKLLKGVVYRGKKIKRITRESGSWRRIHFSDGSSSRVGKKIVAFLARSAGTAIFAKKHDDAPMEERFRIVLKSIQRQLSLKPKTREKFKDAGQRYGGRVSGGRFRTIRVKGQKINIPENYYKTYLIIKKRGLI